MASATQMRDGTIDGEGKIALSTIVEDASLSMPPRQDAEEVDPRDADSPDKWVRRHKAMVRLTGRHPFNSEPPLKELQAAGWVTPPSLHVVRNHGAVPQLSWENHKLKITGVPKECELSMDDIASGKFGEIVSIPVTFICAGNRRKEQNMTKKTIGFNWGCAAVGNSVWTGVRLCDLLRHCGIERPTKDHRFVHFEGPEGELPQGKTGSYGTSIDMGWALDRERDVLLAFKQNGLPLTPDHGAPLRTLLPGCIGGRMIKWLCKMWVAPTPSENHYHYFDNRVLPPHVDAQIATDEGWWYKPEYIINHMNINSAMFEPRHNSVFYLSDPKKRTMKVAGYAYVGGGLKIIRAEISLDGGASWELTNLTSPEDEIAAARGTDKHWCWSWFETEVEVERLLQCKEICVRAVDCNQNMQPMHLTWNVMGMMNNCLFRIKVHPLTTDKGPALWFEHPTQPGAETGGWMTEDAGKFDPAKASEAAAGPSGAGPKRPVAAYWSQDAAAPRGVGVAGGAPAPAPAPTPAPKPAKAAAPVDPNAPFLNPKKFQKMPLIEKIIVSHDTRIFRFGLASPTQKLGLPTGMHIFLKATWKGEVVMRPYTPMTDNETLGHVDFLIKVYYANVHPKFPDGGKMSQHLDSMKIGDTIDAKGPLGEFVYEAPSRFQWNHEPSECRRINMIAGGTGLTPCWQVANAVLRNPEDKTEVRLVYANQTPQDILAREQLDALAAAHPDRFKIWYTVDRVPEVDGKKQDWAFDVGFISEAMLREHLFGPAEGTITVMCGPPPMLKFACIPNLEKMGHTEKDIYSF